MRYIIYYAVIILMISGCNAKKQASIQSCFINQDAAHSANDVDPQTHFSRENFDQISLLNEVDLGMEPFHAVLSDDASTLATANGVSIILFDLFTNQQEFLTVEDDKYIMNIVFHNSGELYILVGHTNGIARTDNIVEVLAFSTNTVVTTFRSQNNITDILLFPNSDCFIVNDGSRNIRLLNTVDGSVNRLFRAQNSIWSWDLYVQQKNQTYLIYNTFPNFSDRNSLSIFGIEDSELVWENPNSFSVAHTIHMGSSDEILTGLSNGTITLWDLETETIEPVYLLGHTERITSLYYLSDNLLLSSSYDGTIRLWDLDIYEEISQISTGAIFWSSVIDGSQIITVSREGVVRYWGMPD